MTQDYLKMIEDCLEHDREISRIYDQLSGSPNEDWAICLAIMSDVPREVWLNYRDHNR